MRDRRERGRKEYRSHKYIRQLEDFLCEPGFNGEDFKRITCDGCQTPLTALTCFCMKCGTRNEDYSEAEDLFSGTLTLPERVEYECKSGHQGLLSLFRDNSEIRENQTYCSDCGVQVWTDEHDKLAK
jgi:hypothetical protein